MFAAVQGQFNFLPSSGYRITGYDLAYSVDYSTGTYLVTGNEPFPDEFGVPPGTLFGLTGSFGAVPDIGHFFDSSEQLVLSGHIGGAVLPPVYAGLTVDGTFNFCLPGDTGDLGVCRGYLYDSMTLNSLTITPNVAAIPEPSSYALMLLGLAAIGLRHRRTQC